MPPLAAQGRGMAASYILLSWCYECYIRMVRNVLKSKQLGRSLDSTGIQQIFKEDPWAHGKTHLL